MIRIMIHVSLILPNTDNNKLYGKSTTDRSDGVGAYRCGFPVPAAAAAAAGISHTRQLAVALAAASSS